MPASVKQLRDNQNNFIYPKIAKEGLVEPIYGSDVTISTIDGLNSSDVQGALNELVTNLGNIDSVLDNVEIVKTASGSVINVSDSADYRLLGLKLYGKSVQDGTPTPESPVEIESVGDGGNITTQVRGTNLFFFPDSNVVRNGVTFETSGGIVKISGTSTAESNIGSNLSISTGTYYVSGNVSGVIFRVVYRYSSDDDYTYCNAPSSFTLTGPPYEIFAQILVLAGNTVNATIYPMVNAGSTSIPWEPYKSQTLTYPTPNGLPGIPVESGGNYTDEDGQQWVCDEVDFGAGKKTQRVGMIDSYNSESVGDVYMSSTGQLTTGAKVLYPLSEPIETDLTPEQLAAYAALTSYKPNTTITTDSDPAAGIEVKYLTDSGVSEVLDYYASKAGLDGKQDKLTGTTGQFVGFDTEGEAEAQAVTAGDVGAVATDGTTVMAGDFNVGGHRVTNVGAPTAAGDAVRQSDLQAVSDEIDAIIAGTTPVAVPVATDAKAGVVMPGEHLSVEADGTLNAEWPDLSGYLTAIPAEYITEDELTAKGYLTAVPAEYVTDSELTGKGYATTTEVAETYAKKALKFTGTFTASGWTSATGGYNQTINVSGLTADDEPIIDLNSTATDADTFNGQLEAFGLVSNFTTGAGTLTAVVLGDSAPTVDIPIHGVVVY